VSASAAGQGDLQYEWKSRRHGIMSSEIHGKMVICCSVHDDQVCGGSGGTLCVIQGAG
jgi:hypothetical protein